MLIVYVFITQDSDDEMEWVVKDSDEPANPSKPTKQYGVTLPPQAYLGGEVTDAQMKEEEEDVEEKSAASSDGKVSNLLTSNCDYNHYYGAACQTALFQVDRST